MALTIGYFAQPAAAASSNIMGLGLMPYAEALPMLDYRASRSLFLAWTTGFMSGANVALTARNRQFRDLTGLNIELIIGSLKAYCAENPEENIVRGVEYLWSNRSFRPFSP